MNGTIKLFGNNICPYSQRSILSMLELDIEFSFINIDFINPPPWLSEISPLNTVPVLQTSNTTIYHSSSIIEYINEISLYKLLPYSAHKNAIVRSACNYINHIHSTLKNCISCINKNSYTDRILKLEEELGILFSVLLPTKHDANKLDMINIYLIPLLVLINVLEKHGPTHISIPKRGEDINNILLNRDSTRKINNDTYLKLILSFIFTTENSTLNYIEGK